MTEVTKFFKGDYPELEDGVGGRPLNVIGVVVSYDSPPTDLSFTFQIHRDVEVGVGDIIEVLSGTRVIVGRVVRIVAHNKYLMNPEYIRMHMDLNLSLDSRLAVSKENIFLGRVEIIGVIKDGKIFPPEYPPVPGDFVFRASSDTIRRVLNFRDDGVFIGTIFRRDDIRVVLDPEVLLRLHFAVFGATGSGKSYTVGVIIEEFLLKNYPVVIFDLHGEYHTLSTPNDNESDVSRLRNLGLEPRGFPMEVRSVNDINIGFEDLDIDALAEITNMSSIMADLLYLATKYMGTSDMLKYVGVERRGDFNWAERIKKAINQAAQKWKFDNKTRLALIRRIETLSELEIFGENTDISEFIKPGKALIIDLSSRLREFERRVYVGVLLKKIFDARREGRIPPTMVIVEESHNFAPQEGDTYSKTMMRKIAREGRKFGLGIGVVSQRIIGLDKDIISQCGTKIIMRVDSKTDLDYLRPYLGIATKEDIERLPYLPVGTAFITGQATKYPILVRIRPRMAKHLTEL